VTDCICLVLSATERATDKNVAEEEQMDFGAALRHELNNPATGILSNAEKLLAELRCRIRGGGRARSGKRRRRTASTAQTETRLRGGGVARSYRTSALASRFGASALAEQFSRVGLSRLRVAGGIGKELQHAALEFRRLVTERSGVKRAWHDPHCFWSASNGVNFLRMAARQRGIGGIADQ
jgi:signal transduction histidine kinase